MCVNKIILHPDQGLYSFMQLLCSSSRVILSTQWDN